MPEGADTLLLAGEKATFDDPFRMFRVIQGITDSPEAVAIATQRTVAEFAADGVRYLELRSTPRAVPGRMSRLQYCEAVLDQLDSGTVEGIAVKLLLSVDRWRPEELEDTAALLQLLQPRYPGLLAGLDISGDARVGHLEPLLPRLAQLRAEGVRLAVHLAEVPNQAEVAAVLAFGPDRIGELVSPPHAMSQATAPASTQVWAGVPRSGRRC
jgi:hypothetical protein